MIDHQVITSGLTDRHISTNIVNVFSMIPLYGRTTSDHLPVISEFDFNKIITGIDEQHQQQVYPNPTSGDLLFPLGSEVTIINTPGEVIIKQKSAHPPISLSECAPGLYLVVIDDQFFRIIKN